MSSLIRDILTSYGRVLTPLFRTVTRSTPSWPRRAGAARCRSTPWWRGRRRGRTAPSRCTCCRRARTTPCPRPTSSPWCSPGTGRWAGWTGRKDGVDNRVACATPTEFWNGATCLYTRLESLAWSQQGFWQPSFCRKCNYWSLCYDGRSKVGFLCIAFIEKGKSGDK